MIDKHVRQISNLTKKVAAATRESPPAVLALGPSYFTRESPSAVRGSWARLLLCPLPVLQGRPICYSRAPVCGACLFDGFL